jgi:membrane associated rhomboid family serine protease
MPQASSYRRAVRQSVFLPVAAALAIPVLIGLLKPAWLYAAMDFLLVFLVLLPLWCLVRAFTNWAKGGGFFSNLLESLSPTGLDMRGVSGMPIRKIPWVTALLILVNAAVFVALPERIASKWVFPPYGNPSDIHILASVLTSTFLHANFSHLFGNILFLWTFGSVLEERTGPGGFAVVYLAAAVAAELTTMALLVLQADHLGSLSQIAEYHALGASGAVAGVVGAFVVRCYFTRVNVSLPVFILPVIANSIRVRSLVVAGLFFALNLKGSAVDFTGGGGRVAHWAHVGGYLAGFGLAYLMRLHRQAAEEAVGCKAALHAAGQANDARATALYRDLLERHPEDEKALRHFLALHRCDPEKQEPFFARLVRVLARKEFGQALELVEEFFPRHCRSLPGDLLLRFGLHYYEKADFFKARVCFDAAAGTDGPWQAKAMLKHAEVLVCQGNDALAEEVCAEIAARFPQTPFSRRALEVRQRASMGSTGLA